MTSLNPFYMVYQKFREVFRTHCNPRDAYRDEVLALLKKMELPNPETVMGQSPPVMPMRSKKLFRGFLTAAALLPHNNRLLQEYLHRKPSGQGNAHSQE